MNSGKLKLDFEAIRNRIDKEKQKYKPVEWAKKVGVSKNTVANIHGSTKQNPSLKYIISVSLATGKSTDYFLWGHVSQKKENLEKDPIVVELLEAARRVLKSGNQVAIDALERNIRYFDHAVRVESRLHHMEDRQEVLEKELAYLKKFLEEKQGC